MNYHQCKNDMDQLISSQKDVKVNIKNARMILIREWPQVEHGNIYNHLILSQTCDGEEMKKYRSMVSYDYLKSVSVRKILQFTIKNRVIKVIHCTYDVCSAVTLSKTVLTYTCHSCLLSRFLLHVPPPHPYKTVIFSSL